MGCAQDRGRMAHTIAAQSLQAAAWSALVARPDGLSLWLIVNWSQPASSDLPGPGPV